MKALTLILLVFILCSCGVKKDSSSTEVNHINKASFGDMKKETADYTIKWARIDGNKLIMMVTFSGGCIKYSTELVGSEFIMKSLPPKRSIKLILKKEGDCRELKEIELVFDISEFTYKKENGSEIILLLRGFDTPLPYIYKVED